MSRSLTLILASFFVVTACNDSATLPNGAKSVQFLTIGATGTPGWLLSDSLEVTVTTTRIGPAAGVWVQWSAHAEGALLSADSSLTGADGIARVAYTPGWALGAQQVEASVDGDIASTTVTATGMELSWVESNDLRVCGLDSNGKMWCWGATSGETHPTELDDQRRPVAVNTPLRFTALGSSAEYLAKGEVLCGVSTAGEIWCADRDDFDGPHDRTAVAPTLHNLDAPVTMRAVSIGNWNKDPFICAIDTSDFAWCRGVNDRGQLGDGTQIDRDDWVQVLGGLRFDQISAGYFGVCGTALNGRPHCWGGNGSEQLGISPASAAITSPTPIDADIRLKRITQASSGLCGIALIGNMLLCWGPSFPADRVDQNQPSGIVGIPATAESLAGDIFGGRTVSDGRLYRFGYNGGSTADFEFYGSDMLVPDLTGVEELVSHTSQYWCVRHTSGSTICSDRNDRPVGVPLPQ